MTDWAQVENLLYLCDNDFVPPLSTRKGIYRSGDVGISQYLDDLKGQTVHTMANSSGEVIGLTSYRLTGSNPDEIAARIFKPVEGELATSAYITTTLVHPEYRGLGVGNSLNEAMANIIPTLAYCGVRSTWSTNERQLHIYQKYGYREYCRVPNERAEGIDTVYFFNPFATFKRGAGK